MQSPPAQPGTALRLPKQELSQAPAPRLTCRLPLVSFYTGTGGGFVALPDGVFSRDPKGAFVDDGLTFLTDVKPYLRGDEPGSYSWSTGRWLPTGHRGVSPNGSHYAYTGPDGAIHYVEVATGGDRILHPAPSGGGQWRVLFYASEGIYFNQVGAQPGLWLLDPGTGAVATVFTDKPVDAVGGYAAWLPDFNPADPHPYTSPHGPNQILRRDLNGGPTVPWFYRLGRTLSVIGFDKDKHPLILVGGSDPSVPYEVWLVPAAGQGTMIFDSFLPLPSVMADDHGIWISHSYGLELYTPSAGRQLVSGSVGQLGGPVAKLAGPCR